MLGGDGALEGSVAPLHHGGVEQSLHHPDLRYPPLGVVWGGGVWGGKKIITIFFLTKKKEIKLKN